MAADSASYPSTHLAELPLLGTTALPAPAAGSHLACNPTIALAVTVGEAGAALHVWRFGDQGLVSKHLERGGRKVEAVAWREDGKVFQVLSLLFYVSFFTLFKFPYPMFFFQI